MTNESPQQRPGLLVEGVTEGAAQLDVTLELLAEEGSEGGYTASPAKGSATSASCEAETFAATTRPFSPRPSSLSPLPRDHLDATIGVSFTPGI